MRRICFVYSSDYPDITLSDQYVTDILQSYGYVVIRSAWDDPQVDWTAYDLLVIRATWNYHMQPDVFRAWLETIRRLAIPICNPIDVMLWNMDKGYLRQLGKDRIRVVPTVWVEQCQPINLLNTLKKQGWDEAVVKPCISATAMQTIRINHDNADSYQSQFETWVQTADYMVQTFVPQIVQDGEWSLMFFDGDYSHSVLKQATGGDFRVQSDFDGKETLLEPPFTIIEQAGNILKTLDQPLCYARVDGVIVDDEMFMLMELELIEPELFFHIAPDKAVHLADAIRALVVS